MFTASLSTLFPKENTHPASQAYFVCWFAVVMLLKLIFYAEKEAQAGSLALVRFPEAGPAALPIREAGPGGLGFSSWPGVCRLHQRLCPAVCPVRSRVQRVL